MDDSLLKSYQKTPAIGIEKKLFYRNGTIMLSIWYYTVVDVLRLHY